MASRLDEQQLAELRELMGADFSALVEAFLRDSSDRFRALELALAAGETDQARRQAHSLKGSSSNLGALTLSKHCQQLEQLLAVGANRSVSAGQPIDGVESAVTALQTELVAVQAALRQQVS